MERRDLLETFNIKLNIELVDESVDNAKMALNYKGEISKENTFYEEIFVVPTVPSQNDIIEIRDNGEYEYLGLGELTSLQAMFGDEQKIKKLDIVHIDSANVTDMSYMFGIMVDGRNHTNYIEELNLGDLNTSKVTTMQGMFSACQRLNNLDVSKLNTSNVTNMAQMFGASFDDAVYGDSSGRTSLDLSNFVTDKVENFTQMFMSSFGLVEIKGLRNFVTSAATMIGAIFYNCKKLTTIDVSGWDTRNVISLSQAFGSCPKLNNLDVSKWNTSKVTNLYQTFHSCQSLTAIDVSNWDISNVTDLYGCFWGCNVLETLDVSKWNVSKVTTMHGVFCGCYLLETINCCQWENTKVESMEMMFYNCKNLLEVDLSGINSNELTNIRRLFAGCTNLTTVSMPMFDVNKLTNFDSIFASCNKLTKIKTISTIKEWLITNATTVGLPNAFKDETYDGWEIFY